MPTRLVQPTPYSDVNRILAELLPAARDVLRDHWVGLYLEGSLATGDFDEDSDIDFVVVTNIEISPQLDAALESMHDRIATIDSPWAVQLEGSYLSQHAIRRHDPDHTLHPNIERGRGERLKWARHDADWNIHRSILREHGLTLDGPPIRTLVDPVAPDDLRQAARAHLRDWATTLLANPAPLKRRGFQSYTVLSLCRIRYTLQFGQVASKPVAARWAQATLAPSWTPLIARAWDGRHNPQAPASEGDIAGTLEFMRDAVSTDASLGVG